MNTRVRSYLREARPAQWLKNVLVLAAPGAAGDLGNVDTMGRVASTFVAFCLVSSGTYFLNDVRDIENDRRHPRKKDRPVAAGLIGTRAASVTAGILVASGVAIQAVTDVETMFILLAYVALTLSYSAGLKNIPLLDLAIVASGFVLRAVAGATATETQMSDWFILCTMFGSLFIVTGKRFAEDKEMGSDAVLTRRTLEAYPQGFLVHLLTLSCGATLLTYCLWALENAGGADFLLPLHVISIVPMSLALFRYVMVIHAGRGSAPEDVFLRDRPIQVYGLGWIIVYTVAVSVG